VFILDTDKAQIHFKINHIFCLPCL